jgi:diguanylate cyclase (GGDEF)-like protein/PAS domain S-box-containing protein
VTRLRLILLPLLILAASLGVTWTVWDHERQASRKELRSQFDFSLHEAVNEVEQRMITYEQMLRGVQGLFAATGTVDRNSLRDYVGALHLDASFSGVQTIGVAEWVPATRKDTHVATMRRLGFSSYTIQPDGQRENYAPIIQREPYLGRNRIPPGFDAWSDPVRRLAMEKARDSGMVAISGKVRFAVDNEADAQPGLIMYLPIYTRGKPQDSVAQRRAHLTGWVYAAFRMGDLMTSLYGQQAPGLALAVYDGVEPSDAARLYPSSDVASQHLPAIISANEYLVVAGHNWLLSMSAQDDFKANFGRTDQLLLIAVTGTGLSLLLAMLAWLMATGRSRALRMATNMTKELRIAAVAFDSQESMIVTDANAVILRVNGAFTESTGYSAEEAVGKTPRLLQSGRHDTAFFREMWETIHRVGGWDGEVWDRRKNGEIYPKWLTISAVKGDDGVVTNYIGTHHDITERKKAEQRINELAFFDQLTGLPNRTLLMDRLRQTMTASSRHGSYGALLFIDLDNFKTLNDTLGHDMGDMLLKQVAQRLTTCVRDEDTVARLGGDEFIVMLASVSTSDKAAAVSTEAIADKMLAVLNRPYQLGSVAYHSTSSIGVTLCHGQQVTIDDLMKQADLAMYRAKAAGRNAVRFFDPTMEFAVMARAALESELRQAIEEKQFLLHYQAQVVGDGRLTGAEVLARWQHPRRGLVSPAEFIPLAEETGLILPLGHWVLETACTQLAAWAAQPNLAHLTIAVNVSAYQFRQAEFVEQTLAILTKTGANPQRLKLELTESLLVSNIDAVIEKMFALKAKGVGFSLDDFGTGYSSLSYLKHLPLDQLKIDQSFVHDVLSDPNDAAIAKTIIALAQSLGLGVIAEGVENAAQRDFLSNAGCHAYQGYFFSRPLPLDGFEQLVQRGLIRLESI